MARAGLGVYITPFHLCALSFVWLIGPLSYRLWTAGSSTYLSVSRNGPPPAARSSLRERARRVVNDLPDDATYEGV